MSNLIEITNQLRRSKIISLIEDIDNMIRAVKKCPNRYQYPISELEAYMEDIRVNLYTQLRGLHENKADKDRI
jgi:hypothetical protein